VSPGHWLTSLDVGTKSEECHAADNVMSKVKNFSLKYISGKDVWRMRDQGPLCRDCAPLMISWAFAVTLSWFAYQNKVPNILSAPPWVPQQNNRDHWAHTSAACLWTCRIVSDHSWQKGCGMTSNHRPVSSIACQLVKHFSQWS